MKKSFIAVFAIALLASAVSFAAESSVAGGFEASGNVVAGAGWQRFKTTGAAVVTRDVNGNLPGPIGSNDTTAGAVNKEDVFKFFVDQAELDVAKSFGENIRIRADLDFGSNTMNGGARFNNGAGPGAAVGVLVEQAYATANLALGNGVEFLLGRFNAPIGFEKINIIYNDTISHSIVYRALRPNTFTGAKFYYAFSDMVDWHLYVVNTGLTNDMGDFVALKTDIPGAGTRIGFNWGEEGKKSTLGVSGAYGQDHTNPGNMKKHLSFLGDADWQWWVTDNFAFGGEAVYRQIDTRNTVAGQNRKNGKYFGALANFHYDFSDVWDGTLRFAWAKDVNGANATGALVGGNFGGAALQSLTGAKQSIYEFALAGNYAIADGAKLKLEGDYSLYKPTGASKQQVFGFAAAFAYEF